MRNEYTSRKGQYLDFICYYTKIYGYPPAEADMHKTAVKIVGDRGIESLKFWGCNHGW